MGFLLKTNNTNIKAVNNIIQISKLIIEKFTSIGPVKPDIPRTASKLKIFEPIIPPSATCDCPR